MKKVLIITYYWPPSGGSGVQRWLKMSKYLPEYGWQPIIFTPANPDFNLKDESLLEDIHPQVEIIKCPIWEPYQILDLIKGKKSKRESQALDASNKSIMDRLAIWVRGNFLIPDPRLFWAKPASKFIIPYIKEHNIQWMVTTSPPHSMHLVGLRIKKKCNIKWLVDLRDPWSDWDLLSKFKTTKWARKRHQKLERKVIQHADKVISVSPSWAADLDKRYNIKSTVITNGYDANDFITVNDRLPSKFRIMHVGLLNAFRVPNLLLKALRQLIETNQDLANDFELYLAGMVDKQLQDMLESDDVLGQCTIIKGYIPHDELLREYHHAAVLLMLQNQTSNAKGHIPGKVFEYLAAKRWILGIGNENSDVANIIEREEVGVFCNPQDFEGISNAILGLYQQYKEKTIVQHAAARYTRSNLAKQVANLLDSLT